MKTRRKEATKLVQHLRKSNSPIIQTLLWLPGAVKPFLCCLHRPDPASKPFLKRNRTGTNSEETYYVIRLNFPNYGLSSLETFVAAGCAYAEKHGYIPVVDLKNFKTMYQEQNELGAVNIWERYYDQPAGVSLDDAEQGCRILYGDYCGWRQNFLHCIYFRNLANQKTIRRVFAKSIRLNAPTRAAVDSAYQNLHIENEKLLGVVARGTDYSMLRPEMHSIPPETQRMIDRARSVMREHACTRIFLATEDLDVLSAFRDAFGEQLVYNEALRFHAKANLHIAEYPSTRPNDRYLRGLEYLTTLEILSRCDCLVGMGCSAFNYAALRRPQREYVELVDAGTY